MIEGSLRRPRLRAYSLIELAMALALASIVTTAALSTFSVVNRQLIQMRTEVAVEAKLQRSLAGLVADLQEVGGGAIRPWHGLFVFPGVASTNGSDAILAFTFEGEWVSGNTCPVVSYIGSTIKVGQVLDNPQPFPAPVPPATHCCLQDGTFPGRFAAVTLKGDAVLVAIDAATINLAACTVTAPTYFTPPRNDNTHQWETGTMSVVDAKWIALDHAAHNLNAYVLQYKPTLPPAMPGLVPPGMPIGTVVSETRTMARDVYDFQVATGYDYSLSDGAITESANGANDEWLGNAGGEASSETWVGDEATETPSFPSSSLRMIEVGILAGLTQKVPITRGGKGVLNGPEYPGVGGTRCGDDHTNLFLRGGRARVLLRNSGLYE